MNENETTLHLGINAISLLSPLTGVGQYTFNLTRELQKIPGLTVYYFYGLLWSERCYLDERLVQQVSQPLVSRNIIPYAVNLIKKAVKAVIPRSYEVARWQQQRIFTRGVRERAITLYHDPNFIPFSFDGPVVITVHDLSLLKYPETHPQDRLRAIGRLLPKAVECADAVIVVSDFVRREVIATLDVNPGKVFTVPNGVGHEFQPLSRTETEPVLRRYGLTHQGYILTVGTLEPRKNLIRLVRAYRLLPAALQHHYPLVVAGMKGWHYESIEQALAGLVKSGQVRLPGYLPASDLPAMYAGAAVMVYPSLYEGFGLPPLEAMASGVPVVTSNRSSLPEVVADAGILVEPEDEAAIAESIRTLLDDEHEAHKLIQRGLKRARQFTWERCAQETVAVYRQALEVAGATPA